MQMASPSMYRSPEVENSARYTAANEYQKDLLLFMNMLQTTHPAFCNASTVPFDFEQVLNDGFSALAGNNDVQNLRLILQSVAAKLGDGHTVVSGIFNFNDTKFYPLNLKRREDKYYIRVTDKEYSKILGMSVKSINNIPIDTLVNKFSSFVSHENINELNERVAEFLLLPHLWEKLSFNRTDGALFIEFHNDSNALIFPKFRNDMLLEPAPQKQITAISAPTSQLFSYNIDADKKICYLQFNACVDYNTFVYQIEMTAKDEDMKKQMYAELESQKENYPKFDELLEKMFSEMRVKNLSVLVIDVRNNGGGNSALCSQLLSYLKPHETINEISSHIRISELFKLQYPELYQMALAKNGNLDTDKLYDTKDLKIAEDGDELFEKYFPLNKDESKIFKGKIYFLQGTDTYSSAGELITMVRDNNIGIIVGENGIFKPCNYGDILMWQLPNTGETGGISHKYFTRPDKNKCDENYLAPDVEIQSSWNDLVAGNDKYWEWILENYAKQEIIEQ
jgi:hypothetical protein